MVWKGRSRLQTIKVLKFYGKLNLVANTELLKSHS